MYGRNHMINARNADVTRVDPNTVQLEFTDEDSALVVDLTDELACVLLDKVAAYLSPAVDWRHIAEKLLDSSPEGIARLVAEVQAIGEEAERKVTR